MRHTGPGGKGNPGDPKYNLQGLRGRREWGSNIKITHKYEGYKWEPMGLEGTRSVKGINYTLLWDRTEGTGKGPGLRGADTHEFTEGHTLNHRHKEE